MAFSVLGSPWVEVGNDRLRYQMELLNDAGITNIPTTTWPVMWSDVKKNLDFIDTQRHQRLSPALRSAIAELRFEMRYQTRHGVKRSVQVTSSSARPLFRDFSSETIEQHSLSNTIDWDGESFAVKLKSNFTSESDDDYEAQLDGSYIMAALGNWSFGVGAIDRWWGPGQQSNLILSNNARPIPALQLRTIGSQQFSWSWLKWVGDWQFDSFLGQLESDRVIPEGKILGMRFTFIPLDGLEIGLTRTAQFGGEDRSEDLETFFNVLTTRDENEAGSEGNQLAGIDIRYGFTWLGDRPASVYMQAIGEDEAGFLPAQRIYQFGIQSILNVGGNGDSLSSFVEVNNTITDGLFGDDRFDTAFEHTQFQTGYRFRGRNIASTFDNDARTLTAGLNYYKTNGEVLGLVVTYADLNTGGVSQRNTVSVVSNDIVHASLNYQRYLFEGRLNFRLEHASEKINAPQADIDQTRVELAWEYRY